MAHTACGPRGGERACLRGCWGGGDHACTRRGRCMVCGCVSRVAHGRALGMLAERLGMAWACGPVAGLARGWDREGGGVLAISQTRLARLVWPLANRRQRGGKCALGLLTIDG